MRDTHGEGGRERERQRQRQRQRHRQREKQAPCREPDVGLDPGSPGPCPRLQVALNRCATKAALKKLLSLINLALIFQSILRLKTTDVIYSNN